MKVLGKISSLKVRIIFRVCRNESSSFIKYDVNHDLTTKEEKFLHVKIQILVFRDSNPGRDFCSHMLVLSSHAMVR